MGYVTSIDFTCEVYKAVNAIVKARLAAWNPKDSDKKPSRSALVNEILAASPLIQAATAELKKNPINNLP